MRTISRGMWLAGLAILAMGCQQPGTATTEISAPRQPEAGASVSRGGPAADFTLKTIDGNELRLSDFKGKPVVLNFWASWCPPCREEAPGLEATYKKYRDQGFVIIGIASSDQ